MFLHKKISSFVSIHSQVKLLFFKAYILSAFVKFSLIFLPFKVVLNRQGKINSETPDTTDNFSVAYRKDLKSAMRLCEKYTFWKTECYTLALTAKILLNRNDIPGTIYIGFKKEEDGKYEGHAWLRSYDMIITGGEKMDNYLVHSFYS
ncbi:MAG: lasso peptide biosynthesis B2 protein [Chitinophagaceae bacterium]